MSDTDQDEILTGVAPVRMTHEQSSVLLRRARGGSQQALGSMFDLCGNRLLGLIRMRLGPELRRQLESQDILQMTFLKAFQNIEQFEGSGRQTLGRWLAGIARNEIRDQAAYYQRQRRDGRLRTTFDSRVEAGQVRSEISRIALRESTRDLERAIEALQPAHREVILLRHFEELPFAEIGERLDRTADAARMLFTRAMVALTVRMRALREDPAT